MEFTQPDRLLLLALVPLLFFLSLPPRPKRTVITAHLSQWLAARRKLKRRPVRFRWLRFLLLVGAFLAAVLAHSEPRLVGSPGPDQLVILLDGSASMAATGADGTSTWDSARRAVSTMLETVPAFVDVRIGLCTGEIEVLRGTRRELLDRLAGFEPKAAGRVDLEAAAAALQSPSTAVFTVTDGLGATRTPTAGALVRVGGPAANLGLAACRVRDAWPLPEVKVQVTVVNGSERPVVARVTAAGGIEAPVETEVRLDPAATETVEIPLVRGEGGRLVLALVAAAGTDRTPVGNALAADDRVEIDLPAPPRPQIVLRSPEAPSKALEAVARALARECRGEVVLDAATTAAGFALLEGGQIAGPPREGVRMLTFGTGIGAGAGEGTADEGGPTSIVDWDRSHRLTRGLDLSELRVERTLEWPAEGFPGPEDLVPIRGERGPLAVLHRSGATASVHFAFRLGESNLWKLAAFPQLIRRAFAASYGSAARASIRPGAVLDEAESRLVPARAPEIPDRPLAEFAQPPRGLAVPLLLLALLLLAIRVYV